MSARSAVSPASPGAARKGHHHQPQSLAYEIAEKTETPEARVPVSQETVERVALLLSRSWRPSERGHGKRATPAVNQGRPEGARR